MERDQIHFYFDAREAPRIRVAPGSRLIVETEDAHMGSIRTEDDVYQTLAEVFAKLGGANPVTGPIYVEGVEPGDCVSLTFEDIVPGPVQGQGYTVLTPGLGGLVSNYTLQPSLTANVEAAYAKYNKAHPTAQQTVPTNQTITNGRTVETRSEK